MTLKLDVWCPTDYAEPFMTVHASMLNSSRADVQIAEKDIIITKLGRGQRIKLMAIALKVRFETLNMHLLTAYV